MFNKNEKLLTYIDDLYDILYDCKINTKCICLTVSKYKPYIISETHVCYIKFIMYINNKNIKKIYDFLRLLVLSEISTALFNCCEIEKFLNGEKYGLFIYTSDFKNINGGPIIISSNDNIYINITHNKNELFCSKNYFNSLDKS